MILALPVAGQLRGGIQGTVTDHAGAVVKGAKVTLTTKATGSNRVTRLIN